MDDHSSTDAYRHAYDSAEFHQLRRRLARFVFPVSAAFLSWYVAYVLLATYAHSFMSYKVWGNINVALLIGLAQFVTTFAITWAYVRFANRTIDPLAASLWSEIERDLAQDGDSPAGQPGQAR